MHSSATPSLVGELDHLTSVDYDRIASIISSQIGIRLPPAKQSMVEGRLRKRVRALSLKSVRTYGDYLFRQGGLDKELPYLIDAVTTNKTDFFRESDHFELMRTRMVPQLLKARLGEASPLLKVWSAASSTGAEAYTTAMVLAEMQAQSKDFRYAILATDVSRSVLKIGQMAIYPEEQIAPVPKALQSRYLMFSRRNGIRNDVRIVPELRQRVRFNYLNLMETSYPVDRDVDIIFLRNVLIYFEKNDQQAVIERLMSHLRPGGYLVLGHSESMIGTSAGFHQIAPAVFQKTTVAA